MTSLVAHTGEVKRAKEMTNQDARAVSFEFLDAFAEAWNRHYVDAILQAMTPDCVYESSVGSDAVGTRYVGQECVRSGVKEVFEQFPDARWNHPRHFVAGDRGVTEWVFTGTRLDGTRLEVQGCDVFTFRDGNIAVKNSYRKQRTS